MSRMLKALRRLEATQRLVAPAVAEDVAAADAEASEQETAEGPFELPQPVLPQAEYESPIDDSYEPAFAAWSEVSEAYDTGDALSFSAFLEDSDAKRAVGSDLPATPIDTPAAESVTPEITATTDADALVEDRVLESLDAAISSTAELVREEREESAALPLVESEALEATDVADLAHAKIADEVELEAIGDYEANDMETDTVDELPAATSIDLTADVESESSRESYMDLVTDDFAVAESADTSAEATPEVAADESPYADASPSSDEQHVAALPEELAPPEPDVELTLDSTEYEEPHEIAEDADSSDADAEAFAEGGNVDPALTVAMPLESDLTDETNCPSTIDDPVEESAEGQTALEETDDEPRAVEEDHTLQQIDQAEVTADNSLHETSTPDADDDVDVADATDMSADPASTECEPPELKSPSNTPTVKIEAAAPHLTDDSEEIVKADNEPLDDSPASEIDESVEETDATFHATHTQAHKPTERIVPVECSADEFSWDELFPTDDAIQALGLADADATGSEDPLGDMPVEQLIEQHAPATVDDSNHAESAATESESADSSQSDETQSTDADDDEKPAKNFSPAEVAALADLKREEVLSQYRDLANKIRSDLVNGQHACAALVGAEHQPHVTDSVLRTAMAACLKDDETNVLIIDGDSSDKNLTAGMDASAELGLAEVLKGRVPWQQAVRATGTPGLCLLPAGRVKLPQPEEGDSRLTDLLKELTCQWDLVLIDAGSCEDPLIAGVLRAARNVYLVIRLGETQQQAAEDAVETIRNTGASLRGSVVTNA